MRSVRARRLLKRIAGAVAILVIAGMLYEQVGRRQDRERYPQVGQSVDIGGRSLNISCIGEEGPTVVFDTFGHMAGFGWTAAQAKVSEFVRACWYDRAGYGWSDPAPGPRTFEVVARDLHELLRASELAPPYVFVGGGDAALHLRVYHGLYPSEVAGLLFIDANDVVDDGPEMQAGQGPWRRVFGPFAPQFRAAGCAVRPLLHRIGLMRLVWQLTGSRSTDPDSPTSGQGAQQDFLSDNPTAQRGSELCDRAESLAQVRAAGALGDVPLVVLASRNRFLRRATQRPREIEAFNQYWVEQAQPRLAALSTNGQLRIVDDVQQAVVPAIHDLIDQVREKR